VALILDTNALSALAEGEDGLRVVLSGQSELAVPAIVLGEYLFGIHQSRLRSRYE
jgi:tRNA(fMet)-specific endonuclease VapC